MTNVPFDAGGRSTQPGLRGWPRFFAALPGWALLLGLFVGTGCAGTGGLDVRSAAASRPMPDEVTAWGFYFVPGRLVNPLQINSRQRYSLLAAQTAGLYGVRGTRYRMTIAGTPGTDQETSTLVLIGQADLVNTQVVSCDSMAVSGGIGHYLVTELRVPFTYNEGEGVPDAITSNPAWTVVVPVKAGSALGPRYVQLRAIEAVLKTAHGNAAGTYEGTAFILRCEPRVTTIEVPGHSASRRWLSPIGPTMANAAGADADVIFDVEIVVAEGYTPPWLADGTLQPLDSLLPH